METKQEIKDFPEIRGNSPWDVIANFYKDLGWDGFTPIKPAKVIVSEDDWNSLYWRVIAADIDPDPRDNVSAGGLFVHKGPSADKDIEKGKVVLEEGWI